MYADAQALTTLVFLAATFALVAWVSYRASRVDDKLDRFLAKAFALNDENWTQLGALVSRSHRSGTCLELASNMNASSDGIGRLRSSLADLEEHRLIRRTLTERGGDIVSTWKTVV